MQSHLLRTTVIGSYPFPNWLEFATANLDEFGSADLAEMQDDAATCAIADQLAAGLDAVTDGEQTRFDFNLSFYGHLDGIALEPASPRRFGPPAHDQRGKHEISGELTPKGGGLGTVEEFELFHRAGGVPRRPDPRVPEVRVRRAAGVRPRLRVEPDSALGSEAKAG